MEFAMSGQLIVKLLNIAMIYKNMYVFHCPKHMRNMPLELKILFKKVFIQFYWIFLAKLTYYSADRDTNWDWHEAPIFF